MNVNRNESGMDAPITSVALGLFKNRKMTKTAMIIPVIPEFRTFERLFFMLLASSEKILYVKAPSVSEDKSERIFLMLSLILTVLAPDLLVTETMTRLLPSDMA